MKYPEKAKLIDRKGFWKWIKIQSPPPMRYFIPEVSRTHDCMSVPVGYETETATKLEFEIHSVNKSYVEYRQR